MTDPIETKHADFYHQYRELVEREYLTRYRTEVLRQPPDECFTSYTTKLRHALGEQVKANIAGTTAPDKTFSMMAQRAVHDGMDGAISRIRADMNAIRSTPEREALRTRLRHQAERTDDPMPRHTQWLKRVAHIVPQTRVR